MAKNRSKFTVPAGRVAVLYAGTSGRGKAALAIYETLQKRQKDYLAKFGLVHPIVLVTDVLAEIGVEMEGKKMRLNQAMLDEKLFGKGENEQLWEEASSLFSRANKSPFVWRGTVRPDKNPILDAYELPIQILNGNKLSSRTEKAVIEAMKKVEREEEPGEDMLECSDEIKRLSFAVDQRDKMLQKYKMREGHPTIKKLLN